MNRFPFHSSVGGLDPRPARTFNPTCPGPRQRGAQLLVAWLLVLLATPSAHARKGDRSPAHPLPSPEFSLPGGVFTSNLMVRVESPVAGARVLCTLDGSEPGDSTPPLAGPLTVTNSVLLRARLQLPGKGLGPTRSETYFLLDEGLRNFSSDLPLAIVHTAGRELSRDRKDPAAFRLMDLNGRRVSLQGPGSYDGRVMINIRGRASLRYPKRSYTLKLVDEEGEDRGESLLGMPSDEDWILYAPYPDKTLMRDALAYEISRNMGHWAPRTRFIELFVTEGRARLSREDYVGVYVLEERLKRHPERVAIHKLSPGETDEPSVSGGYILKKDHVDRGYFGPPDLLGGGNGMMSSSSRNGFPTPPGGFPADPAGFLPTYRSNTRGRDTSDNGPVGSSSRRIQRRFSDLPGSLTAPVLRDAEGGARSSYSDEEGNEYLEHLEEGFATGVHTNQLYYVEPEEDEITAVQKAWLKRYMDSLESALYGTNFLDPAAGYRAYLDPRSFIDYHLIVEVTKNVDGHRFSTFYSKDRGGRLQAQPIWDWNLSFGNCNGKQGWMPERWLWPQLSDQEYLYFRRLFEDPDFGQAYVDRWGELRSTAFSATNLLGRIDAMTRQLHESQGRNFERWPILGKGVNPNWYVGETYEEEVNWMKEWLSKRLAWIDAQFVPAPVVRRVRGKEGSVGLEWGAQAAGELLYTIDGTDPRSPGGTPSPSARKGPGPQALSQGSRLVARVRVDERWSPPVSLAAE